jgi:hypothetical protein
MTGMSDTIRGADLESGQYIKTSGRVYLTLHLHETDKDGTRVGVFQESDGTETEFLVFEDSVYELAAAPTPLHRMVKVRADDLRELIDAARGRTMSADALTRLEEALR